MMSRILVISVFCLGCIRVSECAPAVPKSRQYIAPAPGLIPVYIRPGDTPLEDINLDLAAAFDNYDVKHGRFTFGRSNKLDDVDLSEDDMETTKSSSTTTEGTKKISYKTEKPLINLDDEKHGVKVAIFAAPPEYVTHSHIQKIHKSPKH